MSNRTIAMTKRLSRYLHEASPREPRLLAQLRKETAATTKAAGMQISPEQGHLMAMLLRLMRARKVLEIGVFTGYSSLTMALALPPNGVLVACDVNAEWTSTARKYWNAAGVGPKIDLRLAPAARTLRKLLKDGHHGSFDFVFIDADKKNILVYYEAALKLVRPGGLIAIDNVLWSGRVADTSVRDRDTVAIRKLNKLIRVDTRVVPSMIPIGDGLTLVLKPK